LLFVTLPVVPPQLVTDAEGTNAGTEETETLLIALGLGIPLLIIVLIGLVVILVLVVLRLYRSKKLERRIEKVPFRNEYNEGLSVVTVEGFEDKQLSAEEQCFYEERFDKAVISLEQLEIGETIGEGTFGVVCKAMFLTHSFPQPVAVKKARNLTSKEQLRSLLKESLLMKRFDHPNIVGLLGVCFDTPEGYPYLVLPFMAKGNIKDYLKAKRVHTTDTLSLPDGITVIALTVMCLDVARGMEYLSCHKFVHRDLAARNCMMDEEGVVKVGDFGLARDVYSHLYYRGDKHTEIPVKWSAPETLTDGLSTEMSDVWSYGVVCWEVFRLGATPYPGVSNYDIPHYINSGKRLPKPGLCPQHVYALMEKCWNIKPEDRPGFSELVASLA
jgi:serine/threonine protein kinase